MTKPSATTAQINALIEKLDDACLGKTPFTCADGTCSDRLFTQQTNIIHDFFTYTKEDHGMKITSVKTSTLIGATIYLPGDINMGEILDFTVDLENHQIMVRVMHPIEGECGLRFEDLKGATVQFN